MDYLKTELVLKEIKIGKVQPFYLLYGEEDARIDDILGALKKYYFNDEEYIGSLYKKYDLKEFSLKDILLNFNSPSFFEEIKLGFIKNFDLVFKKRRKKEKEEILKNFFNNLKNNKDKTMVIYLAKSPQKQKEYESFFKINKLEKYIIYLYPLSKTNLKTYLVEKAKEEGYILTNGALELLIFLCGEDYSLIYSEFNKIKLYSKEKLISEELIEKFVGYSFEGKLKSILEAISYKDKERFFKSLYGYLGSAKREEIPYLIGSLASQLLNIYFKKINVYSSFKESELRDKLDALYKIDLMIKKGESEPEVLLLNWGERL
ncbi:MAG: DNA polymerase III subunit delta [candidate division WOR-3 bacterium]